MYFCTRQHIRCLNDKLSILSSRLFITYNTCTVDGNSLTLAKSGYICNTIFLRFLRNRNGRELGRQRWASVAKQSPTEMSKISHAHGIIHSSHGARRIGPMPVALRMCSHKTNAEKHVSTIQHALQRRKDKLHEKTERLKETGQILLKDIKQTGGKVREKMEEIRERENIWTIPNILCVSRICMAPWLGYLVVQSDFNLALSVFVVAGVTDLLDGWIARTFPSQSSVLGSFLDPMADKVLIGILFVTLTYVDLIPIPLTSLIIVRDVALMSAGFYIRYQSLPSPRTFLRYFDASHPTAQLAPTFLSKVNTTVQLLLVGTTLVAPVFAFVDHPALWSLWFLTAGTTIASAGSYIFSKNTYKIIKQDKTVHNSDKRKEG